MFSLDEFENEFDGLYPNDVNELKYAWNQLLDFAYSPYEPDLNEIHTYMKQIGKIIGEMPPEVLPFIGKLKVE